MGPRSWNFAPSAGSQVVHHHVEHDERRSGGPSPRADTPEDALPEARRRRRRCKREGQRGEIFAHLRQRGR